MCKSKESQKDVEEGKMEAEGVSERCSITFATQAELQHFHRTRRAKMQRHLHVQYRFIPWITGKLVEALRRNNDA